MQLQQQRRVIREAKWTAGPGTVRSTRAEHHHRETWTKSRLQKDNEGWRGKHIVVAAIITPVFLMCQHLLQLERMMLSPESRAWRFLEVTLLREMGRLYEGNSHAFSSFLGKGNRAKPNNRDWCLRRNSVCLRAGICTVTTNKSISIRVQLNDR